MDHCIVERRMRGVDYLVAIYLSIIKAVLVADRKIFVKIFGN